jgi:hypothetical protein
MTHLSLATAAASIHGDEIEKTDGKQTVKIGQDHDIFVQQNKRESTSSATATSAWPASANSAHRWSAAAQRRVKISREQGLPQPRAQGRQRRSNLECLVCYGVWSPKIHDQGARRVHPHRRRRDHPSRAPRSDQQRRIGRLGRGSHPEEPQRRYRGVPGSRSRRSPTSTTWR